MLGNAVPDSERRLATWQRYEPRWNCPAIFKMAPTTRGCGAAAALGGRGEEIEGGGEGG